jgi:L,D-transpeptidase YcbB
MNTTRRIFLTGASVLAVNLLARSAFAQDAAQPEAASPDVIGDILKSDRRGNWSDDFDAQASQGEKIASKLPIFSPQTVTYI